MRMGMRRAVVFAGILGLVAAAAGLAEAQTTVTVASENFDAGLPTGWTITNSDASVGWAVDATPVAGNPSTTSSLSLNYNDGTDYANVANTLNNGTARSDTYLITNAALTTFRVAFYCLRDTETETLRSNNKDTCVVKLFDDSSATVPFYQAQLVDPNGDPTLGINQIICVQGGGWHQHPITLLTPPTGSITVEFSFDTVDNQNNTEMGWFVDDFLITAVDPAGGGTPPPPPGYDGPGYYDPSGVWIGFPNGDALIAPAAPAGPAPGTEPGSLDPVTGVYTGTEGSPAGSGGEGDEGICGLIGLEFLLPLALIGLARRRRR